MLAEKNETHRFFPLFVDSRRCRIVVVGGGAVAERRTEVMTQFEFPIDLISETVTKTLRGLAEEGKLAWIKESFKFHHLDGADVVLACTDDRETNRSIGVFCRGRGVLVNVCDAREESTFWFPAIACNDDLTMGLIGDGSNHGAVRDAAAHLRGILKEGI